ncbi:unnamed protein product [Bemisia tabaci]|uniref:Major facilitator superfamily (MFS) profile domain-containing protein n=2 Tax=Bemisia tabaci TaxID=7038 RepID=A0A9P0F409_BEMTA|nr:unnamed protein product [Bemisia tabaci]
MIFNFGMMLSMPTIVLGALHNRKSEALWLDDDQASWFGSILFATHPLGSVCSGFFQTYLGRKGSMLLVNILFFVAWITLYSAQSPLVLSIAALTMGLGIGFDEAPLHSYIGEMSEPHLRATLCALLVSCSWAGALLMYLIAYLAPWRTVALISSAVPIFTIICISQIPESPTWYIMKGRLNDAQKSLCWLRGWTEPDVTQAEFEQLCGHIKKSSDSDQEKTRAEEKYEAVPGSNNEKETFGKAEGLLKTKFRELTNKKLLLPLRMVFIVFIFSRATQLTPMGPYMIGILDDFGFPADSKLILFVAGLSGFAGTLMNILLVRKLGKRKMSLTSQGTVAFCMLLLGVYCSFFDRSNRILSLTWIPISLLVIAGFFGGLSMALLPWQLLSEVFPLKGRGVGGGVSAAYAYYVSFAMTKTYLYLEHWIQLNGVFFFYGGITLFGVWYLLRYLPETEGKSLEQIETYFTKNYDKKEMFSKPRRSAA